VGECTLDSSGPREGPVPGPCEHGNKPFGSMGWGVVVVVGGRSFP
jgi:hypothetical protein